MQAKFPDEIVADFMRDRSFLTKAGRIEAETSLRSSLASVLCWSAEQMPKDSVACNMCGGDIEDRKTHGYDGQEGQYYCAHENHVCKKPKEYPVCLNFAKTDRELERISTIDDCKAILINEAKKISSL